MNPVQRHRLERLAWLAAASVALASAFALYTQPAFLVTLVDQVWACF